MCLRLVNGNVRLILPSPSPLLLLLASCHSTPTGTVLHCLACRAFGFVSRSITRYIPLYFISLFMNGRPAGTELGSLSAFKKTKQKSKNKGML
ncbi:hypothetical protein B0H63DRAFT_486494 [Podospora didyma]|uniref:Uncharacterized protein n=1 Tax=Podospora didyma TaxID=330526 RepID=A0AAE0K514_9PEZI|nr:hypothetical protein B0H63DRAFT_486494 [Podospora didyma]